MTSVQARLCQCFYLLSQSRINHCWNLFGTTAHLALAIGLNRRRRWDTSNRYDLIELECCRRVFWCAYSLDNYLSASLGRPRTFKDEDIDQVGCFFGYAYSRLPQWLYLSSTLLQHLTSRSILSTGDRYR